MGSIVDVYGRPIEMDVLTQELALPDVGGVRPPWQPSVAAGLTPEELVHVLEGSVHYDPERYLTLAEEMEEREGHYYSVLSTRRLGVESVPVQVEAASDDKHDIRIADFVRELMRLDCVEETRSDLLDGLGKSFSVCEIVWDRSGRQWMPERIEHRDPRWFVFDQATQTELRLRDQEAPTTGLALKPYKYIIHRPKLKCGLQVRNGLARIAAFSWICKAYALKDWLAFAEVFGMPVRIGRYPRNASPKDIQILRRAVANIGTDAACVIPESMNIEFQQAGNMSGASDVFKELCNYLDRQISKIVLGQTMTADAQSAGLGSRNADVHNEVRGDIRDADGRQLAITYKRDLVRAAVDLNFGPQRHYPRLIIQKPDAEDLKQLTDSLKVLVPMGMRVSQSEIRDKLRLEDPADDDELLQAPGNAPPVQADPALRSLNRRQDAPASVVDLQVARLAAEAGPAIESDLLDPIQQIVEASTSFEELRERLIEAYPAMETAALSELLADAMAAAHLAGRYELLIGR